MNEGALWRWLSKRLPPGNFTRIESPCSPGVPDVNYTLDVATTESRHVNLHGFVNVHGWIELKIGAAGRYPFKRERRGLRASQCIWLKTRLPLGTTIAIAAVIGPDFAVWRLKASQVDTFNDLDRDALRELAVYWVPRRTMKRVPVEYLS